MGRLADAGPGRTHAGFTLLEVLIAFAITAFTLAVLLPGTVGALRAAGTAREYQSALVRARSRLATLEGGALVEGERGGDDGGGFRWQTRVTRLATARDSRTAASLPPGAAIAQVALYAVTVTVSWGKERPPRLVSLDSQRLAMAALPVRRP